MCFNQDGAFYLLNDKPLKLVDQFICLGSNILYTKCLYAWVAISYIQNEFTTLDKLSTIWKFYISDKIKRKFFQMM